jgi:hypothetical protein
MRVEEKPLEVGFLEQDWDCVWLSFKGSRFLSQPILQNLDWKLRGMLTKFFPKPPATTTFLPTMKRIAAAYVVVENSAKADWAGFYRHCEGLKVKRIGLVTDDRSSLQELKKIANKQESEYPETIALFVAPEG